MDKNRIANYIHPMSPIPTGLSPSGNLTGQIRAMLFDVYGTLFISAAGDISIAENQSVDRNPLDQLIDRYGLKLSSKSVVQALYRQIRQVHDALKKNGIVHPEVDIRQIWQTVLPSLHASQIPGFATEFEMIVNPVYPMPHLKETLEAIRHRRIVMGIISNAQFFTPFLFKWFLGDLPQHLGFDQQLLFYSYEHGLAKPSMALFEKAVSALSSRGIFPDNVLYIGNDMRNDILPAHSVGFHTGLFAGDQRSLRLRENDPDCQSVKPDLVITDLNQIPERV